MPTVIDSLIVALNLDVSKFSKNQKGAISDLKKMEGEATRTAKEMEARGKQAAEFFSKIRTQAVGFLAMFAGASGIKSFVSNVNAADTSTGYLAKNLGMTADQLSAWEAVAERTGGSAAGMASSMRALSADLANFALTGQSSVIPAARAMGIALADEHQKARPIADIYREISNHFQKMTAAEAQARGREWLMDEGTVNVLMQGGDALERQLALQERIGHATEKDTEAAMKLHTAWTGLSQATEDLGRKMQTDATPGLISVLNAGQKFTDWGHENIGKLETGVLGLTGALAALRGLSFIKLIGNLLGITPAISGIGKAIGAVVRAGVKYGIIGNVAGFVLDSTEANTGEDEALAKMSDADRAAAVGNTSKVGSAPTRNQSVRDKEGVKKAMAFFQNRGWSKEASAGLAANFDAESGFDPQAVGDNGKAYGIGQWHKDRQEEFKRHFGKDIKDSTLEEQMAFADYELRTTHKAAGDALKKAKTKREAGEIGSRKYEMPGATPEARDREAAARSARADAIDLMAPGPKPDSGLVGGAGARVAATTANDNRQANTSTTEVNIANQNIYTAATDANGIARDIGPALKSNDLASQANSGL